jgi:hypothetical protein
VRWRLALATLAGIVEEAAFRFAFVVSAMVSIAAYDWLLRFTSAPVVLAVDAFGISSGSARQIVCGIGAGILVFAAVTKAGRCSASARVRLGLAGVAVWAGGVCSTLQSIAACLNFVTRGLFE